MYSQGTYKHQIMTRTIHVEPTDTKQRAYEVALSTLKSLETLSANKLNSALNIIDSKANKTHIEEGSYVTVQERKTGNGKMEYVGLANVRIHYLAHDNNN
jgi:hypothetical protein